MKQILFEIGQRVRSQNFTGYRQYENHDCYVVKELGTQVGHNDNGDTEFMPGSYQVKFADGQRINVGPTQLKLAKPLRGDMDKVVRWKDCPWKPTEWDIHEF